MNPLLGRMVGRRNGHAEASGGEGVVGWAFLPGRQPRRFEAEIMGTRETGEEVVRPVGRWAQLLRLPPGIVVHPDAWIPASGRRGERRGFFYFVGATRAVQLTDGREIVAGAAMRSPAPQTYDPEESEAIRDAIAIAHVFNDGLVLQMHSASLMGATNPMGKLQTLLLVQLVGTLFLALMVGALLLLTYDQGQAVQWLIGQAAAGASAPAVPADGLPAGFPRGA